MPLPAAPIVVVPHPPGTHRASTSPGRTPMKLTTLRWENPQSHVGCRPALVLVLATYWRTHRTTRALLSLMTKPENTNSERIPEVIPCIAFENGPYRRDPNRVTALAADYFRGLCLNGISHSLGISLPSRCSARSTWTLSPSCEVIVGRQLIARAAKVRRPCRWPSIIRSAVVAVWTPAVQLKTARWWTGSSTRAAGTPSKPSKASAPGCATRST